MGIEPEEIEVNGIPLPVWTDLEKLREQVATHAKAIAELQENCRVCIECDINSREDCAEMMGEVNTIKEKLAAAIEERNRAQEKISYQEAIAERAKKDMRLYYAEYNEAEAKLTLIEKQRDAFQVKLERVRETLKPVVAACGGRLEHSWEQLSGSRIQIAFEHCLAVIKDILDDT